MGWFDVHAHLTDPRLAAMEADVVARAEAAGVTTIISNGLNPRDNQKVADLAARVDIVRPAFGLYPVDAVLGKMLAMGVEYHRDDTEVPDPDASVAWVADHVDEAVAVGEIGLDHYWVPEELWDEQEAIFRRLVTVAMESDKPIIIHSRKAERRAFEVLTDMGATRVNWHCFGSKVKLAQRIAEAGHWLSIPANARKSESFSKMLRVLPRDKVLLETDCPYLAPERGQLNEPANVTGTAAYAAELWQTDLDGVQAQLSSNFEALFGFAPVTADETRRQVVEALDRIGFLMAVNGASGFKAKAYSGAARTIRSAGDIAAKRASGELESLRGIGRSVLDVVDDVLAGRAPSKLVALEEEVPPTLYELRKLRGLGPGRIATLWKKLGITNLAELEYATVENRLLDLDGFGAATQTSLAKAIARIRENDGNFHMAQVRRAVDLVRTAVPDAVLTGDHRRGEELVTEVDLLATSDLDLAALAAVIDGPPEPVEAHGLGAVRLIVGGVPVRLFANINAEQLGAALLYTTGPAAYVDRLVAHAAAKGMRLSAQGLVRKRSPLDCATEDAVYAHLGLVSIAPERRGADTPLLRAGTTLRRLVRREDLQGALHNHTTASDGTGTLDQMRERAGSLGLAWLGISDHSPTAWYANGLDAQRLLDQARAIAAMDGEGCAVLSGVESDILPDGALDHPDEVLDAVDVIVASVHGRARQDGRAMTDRMVTAARNPRTDIIGHPTGRLLMGRPPTDLDVAALLDACAESGCAIECNASPHRLDLSATHLAMARERGVLVSIAADAHGPDELRNLDFGILIARRAGLTAQDVLNTRSLLQLRAWLGARRTAARAT